MDQTAVDRIVAEVLAALGKESAESASTNESPGSAGSADSDADAARLADTPLPTLVTEEIVRAAASAGETTLRIAPGAIVTPLGRDALRETGVALASGLTTADIKSASTPSKKSTSTRRMQIAIAAASDGQMIASKLSSLLRKAGYVPYRVPTVQGSSARLAARVAGAVSAGTAEWGIVIDETGIVAAAAANKAQGVLAASCNDVLTARWAREQLGANMLCISSGMVAPSLAEQILQTWIDTPAQPNEDIASALKELDRG